MINSLLVISRSYSKFHLAILLVLIQIFHQTASAQQKVIPLYQGAAPGSEHWAWKEGETYNTPMKKRVLYNVTQPTLLAFLPEPSIANGSAVIIITGGGGRLLMIDTEGISTALALVKKGVAAFVLKHRLAQSKTDDPWKELMASLRDTTTRDTSIRQLIRNDLTTALKYVREHANEYNIDKNKVGLIGFSAGAVMSANMIYNEDVKPDFAAMNYGVYRKLKEWPFIKSTIPLFIAAATDDQLAPVSHSISLYNHWITSKNSAELHIYAKGGLALQGSPDHGLNGFPANTWISRFVDWMDALGFMKRK